MSARADDNAGEGYFNAVRIVSILFQITQFGYDSRRRPALRGRKMPRSRKRASPTSCSSNSPFRPVPYSHQLSKGVRGTARPDAKPED